MTGSSSVFKSIHETSAVAKSSRHRLLVFFLAFFLPVGIHNYYLGNHIKGLAQSLIILALVIFTPVFISVFFIPFYIAWVTSEGLYYLLWYDVADGDGFLLYDRKNPPKPSRKGAILLAFCLPFGLHNFYLGNIKRGAITWSFVAVILSSNIIFMIFPIYYFVLYLLVVPVLVSWLEGVWMLIKQ